MSLNPTYWGNHIWKIMYITAYTYNNKADNPKELYTLLGAQLPCDKCREHFKHFMTLKPIPEIVTSVYLLKWVNDLQNSVQSTLGRKIIPLNSVLQELKRNDPTIPVPRNKRNVHVPGSKAVSMGVRKPGRVKAFHRAKCAKCSGKRK